MGSCRASDAAQPGPQAGHWDSLGQSPDEQENIFPAHAMKMSDFLTLKKLEPHNVLVKKGLVRPLDFPAQIGTLASILCPISGSGTRRPTRTVTTCLRCRRSSSAPSPMAASPSFALMKVCPMRAYLSQYAD